MDDFLRATHNTVKDNDAKVLAAKMGLPHVSLLQRSNPDDDAHRLTVEHLYGILLHSGDMRPLAALADAFGFDLVAREKPAAQELTSALLHMSAEVADVTRAVTDALDDGRISQIERQKILREAGEARQSIDVLVEAVKAG
ncbi:MAG: phage regulatory CII family protein [Pseudomonadota bacterium]|nr:phage regulatory CII family protein [Pseudomonadota bacterium]